MSVNIPPNPNVSTFNNLYWITGDTPITENIANKKYLKFPVAQGNETLQGISVNGIATFNSTSTFNDDATFNEPVIIADGANNSTISQTTTNLVIQDNAVSGEIDFNTANSSGVITTQLSLNKSKGATFTTNTYVEDSVFIMRDNDTTTTQNNTSYNAGSMVEFNLAPVSLNPADRFRFYSDALGNTIDPLTISRTGISVNPSITFPDNRVQNSAFTGAGALSGSYTTADLTIDTNGKITAISSGSAVIPSNLTPNSINITPTTTPSSTAGINCNVNNNAKNSFYGTGGYFNGGVNAFVAGNGVAFDYYIGGATTPSSNFITTYRILFTFWNSTNWGQTKCDIDFYPNRWTQGQQLGNQLYNINNKIAGNGNYVYTNATYAPNGRQYWTYNQAFSGVNGPNALFVPHNGYFELFFCIPDNTYSFQGCVEALNTKNATDNGYGITLRN